MTLASLKQARANMDGRSTVKRATLNLLDEVIAALEAGKKPPKSQLGAAKRQARSFARPQG